MAIKFFIVLIASFVSTTLNAQTKFSQNSYLDLGYSSISYYDGIYSRKPNALRMIYGQNSTENIGWEGLLGLGLTTDNAAGVNSGNTVGVKVPVTFGLYTKIYIKPNNSFEIFGRAGWASISRDWTCTGSTCANPGITEKIVVSSFSYGAGLKLNLSKNFALTTDYMSYYNRDGISFNATSIGTSYGFN